MRLLEDMLCDVTVFREKLSEAVKCLDIESPEKTLIQDSENGRRIQKQKSGIDKAEKMANALTRLAKSVYDVIDIQNKYSDKDDYEDDGLLEALNSSFVDMEDDSAMVSGDDE